MTVYSLQNIKIVDRNENDLFDSTDLILSSKDGRSIPVESKEAEETLKKFQIGSLGELKSLYFSSQYLRIFEESERTARSERPEESIVLESIQHTRFYAKGSGVSFDENWAAQIQKKSLLQTFAFKTRSAGERAAQGEVEQFSLHIQGIEKLLSRPEVQGLVQWDPRTRQELQLTAFRQGIRKNFLEAEKIARQGSPSASVRFWTEASPNEVLRVDALLEKAKEWSAHPELAAENLFDSLKAEEILRKVLVRSFKDRILHAQREAGRGEVERVDQALEEAEDYSRRPEAREFLRFDPEFAKTLKKKALITGFKVQMDFARGLTQAQYYNWSWQYPPELEFTERVGTCLKKAEEYARRPEASGSLHWEPALAQRIRREADLFLYRQSLREAERGSFIRYGRRRGGYINFNRVQGFLNLARDYSKRPEISSQFQWDEKKANQILKRALKNSFEVKMADAAKIASRGYASQLGESYFQEAVKYSQHPLVLGEIEWDEEKAALLKKKAMEAGLKIELRKANRVFGLQRHEEYERELWYMAHHLVVLPEFDRIHFKDFFKTLSREEILAAFRIARHGAHFAALECNLRAMDNLIQLARACGEDLRVSPLLGPEGLRVREILDHFLALGVERVLGEAEKIGETGNANQAEMLLQRAYEAWVRLGQPPSFEEARWERIRKNAFHKKIELAFLNAERLAKDGNIDQVKVLIKEAEEYSRKADIPFDERRYGKILDLLARKAP